MECETVSELRFAFSKPSHPRLRHRPAGDECGRQARRTLFSLSHPQAEVRLRRRRCLSSRSGKLDGGELKHELNLPLPFGHRGELERRPLEM